MVRTKEESSFFVGHVPISSNAKAITEAINLIKKQHTDKSIYLFTGTDKVAHGCYMSDQALSKGVDVGELGKIVSGNIGGKAGGKGNTIQGMGDTPEGISKAIEELSALLKSKLTV